MEDAITEEMDLNLGDITTTTVLVHTLPFVGAYCRPEPSFRIANRAELTIKDIPPGECTVITATAPLSGQALEGSRQELADAVASMRAAAQEEGGDGFLLGYDPLNPTARIPSSELAIGDTCVFIWSRDLGEGPIFEWNDVAHVVSTGDSLNVFLIDGRLVSLHADIDWWNRLG